MINLTSFRWFLWEAFNRACTSGWAYAGIGSSVLSIAGGWVAYQWPDKLGATISLLTWLVPVLVLGAVTILGIVHSSYRLHREHITDLMAEIGRLNEEAAAARRQIEEMRASMEAEPVAPADLLEMLLDLARTGMRLVDTNEGAFSCTTWYQHVSDFVSIALRRRFAQELAACWSNRHSGDPNIQARRAVNECCTWLRGWERKSLSDEHINPDFTESRFRESLPTVRHWTGR